MNQSHAYGPAEDRPLTTAEARLVQWLLERGTVKARCFIPQLAQARVVSRCGCGCASIDFSITGYRGVAQAGMEIPSDYHWRSKGGYLFGVFVFAREGVLAGLELWSIDGQSTASALPDLEQLRSNDEPY